MEATNEPDSWMTPIKNYILHGTLPEKPKDRRKLLRKSRLYLVQDGHLYRRGYSTPLLRCVTKEESKAILAELHEGDCGGHVGGQTLAKKVLRYGYFWPDVNFDSMTFTKKCDRCQKFAKIPRAPSTELTQMLSPWPFAVWGIDLIGALPTAKSSFKYAIVAVDYFTKWVEAEPLPTITSKKALRFVIKNIVTRFEIP